MWCRFISSYIVCQWLSTSFFIHLLTHYSGVWLPTETLFNGSSYKGLVTRTCSHLKLSSDQTTYVSVLYFHYEHLLFLTNNFQNKANICSYIYHLKIFSILCYFFHWSQRSEDWSILQMASCRFELTTEASSREPKNITSAINQLSELVKSKTTSVMSDTCVQYIKEAFSCLVC